MTNITVEVAVELEIWKSNCVLKWRRRHLTNMKMNRKMNWKNASQMFDVLRNVEKSYESMKQMKFPHRWYVATPFCYRLRSFWSPEILFKSEQNYPTNKANCSTLSLFLYFSLIEWMTRLVFVFSHFFFFDKINDNKVIKCRLLWKYEISLWNHIRKWWKNSTFINYPYIHIYIN